MATLASVPPKVIVPDVVISPPVNVIPLTDPAVSTDVTVPDPKPVAAIVILPAPFVTEIFEPPVIVPNTGSAPVLPMTNWPFVAWPNAVIAPVPLPKSTPPSVNVEAPVPPDPTGNAVSRDKADNSADDPDTITFFQVAIDKLFLSY